MKFYRARETDGSASQTFDSGSQGQIQGKITGKDHRYAVGTKMQNGTFCM
ncbi:putative rhs element protein [Escherichia coli p0305293.10]|nr:putative rhs element protein [Escherichia coli p0305293.10]